jgi:hypothetical protein
MDFIQERTRVKLMDLLKPTIKQKSQLIDIILIKNREILERQLKEKDL